MKLQNRLESIQQLHRLGYASRQEVINAEQQLLEAKAATEETRISRQKRNLDFQLAHAILLWQFSQ